MPSYFIEREFPIIVKYFGFKNNYEFQDPIFMHWGLDGNYAVPQFLTMVEGGDW
tara:strand:- start:1519 stop:1680 length:162 start_codon:yes stop_codon:yes gene_type:complete